MDKNWKASERSFAKDMRVKREGAYGQHCDFQTGRFAFELKTNQAMPESVKKIIEQAKNNAGDKVPVCIWKDKGKGIKRADAITFIRWGDFLELVRDIDGLRDMIGGVR